MKEIVLSNGQIAYVDDEDYDKVKDFSWYPKRSGNITYARSSVYMSGHRNVLMHKLILGTINKPEILLDHEDFNGLNNQKSNLRITNHVENARHRRLRSDNSSGVKGVGYNKRLGKYQARISTGGRRISLGFFDDLNLAKEAYNKAAIKYFGDYAVLNK